MRFQYRRAGILSLLLLAALPRPGVAHSVLLSDREKIAASKHIVVATVTGSAARWNARHSLIVTDYALRIEDRLKGAASAQVRLTMPGGTVGEITDHTCFSVPLETGERYLLFLDDLDTPSLAPVTGGGQGVFHEIREADGTRSAAGPGVAKLAIDGRPVPFATLVAAVRELAGKVATEPAAPQRPPAVSDFPLVSKAYDPAWRAPAGWRAVLPAPLPGLRSGAAAGDLAAEPKEEGKFVVAARVDLPIVVNPLPASSSWSPRDQEEMSYWNLYSSDLFRVMDPPAPAWAYGNGVFDIAGFPSIEQMRQQFNYPWPTNALGVTFWRTRDDDLLIEADIALNPAYAWTLDTAQGNNPASPMWPFRQTMVHELGHAWGLLHPWEGQNVKWDSVLNYSPKAYRVATLWADDTQAARHTYPGTAIRDGAVALYTTRDNPGSVLPYYIPALTGPFAVLPGKPIAVANPARVENVGTVTLKNPQIEVYLTPHYGSLLGAILLKKLTVNATLPAYAVKTFPLGSLAVSATVRRGSYHLALVLRDSADAYLGNNVAWSPQR
jgi:hypothetical protein